jgi:RHS repeat-associated protein
VRQIVSAGGSVLDTLTYGTFGNVLSETNAANGDRFKYAGGEYDSVTGNYHFGARYYDTTNGRWLTQDPLGYASDLNLYRYTHNQPTDRVDDNGLTDRRKQFIKACAATGVDPVWAKWLLAWSDFTSVFPFWPNRCLAWAESFASNTTIPGNPNFMPLKGTGLTGRVVSWSVPGYWSNSHAAYEITLPNGSVWYFDNGYINGTGLATQWEIPSDWKLQP